MYLVHFVWHASVNAQSLFTKYTQHWFYWPHCVTASFVPHTHKENYWLITVCNCNGINDNNDTLTKLFVSLTGTFDFTGCIQDCPSYAAPPNSTADNVHIELLADGTVCVTCFFTVGSDSQGYVALMFSADDPTSLEVLPIQKVASLLRTEVCLNVTKETSHTIAVFDWENGGALGAHPVKIQHLFISLPSTPTIPST